MLRTYFRILTIGSVTLLSLFATDFASAQAKQLKTIQQRASYAIGLDIGRQIIRDNLDLDSNAAAQGLLDALNDKKPVLDDETLRAAVTQFHKEMEDKVKKEGVEFLAANKKKKGVITTKSGLQYMVIKSGKGATPKVTDQVTTHYHGMLIDGTVFDSSVERGQPATFPVSGVIRGWTEALQLMKVGDKWRLFIPSDLAYGARGAGGEIGPHATLIFDIELLGIK